MKMLTWIKAKIRKATHRIWNEEIARILGKAYREGKIDSRQMHDLAARFDPTQTHDVRT
jgi:hypothetical protein